MIYEGITVGITDTVYGCYQVCAAIPRLAAWVKEDFRNWWLVTGLRDDETPSAPKVAKGDPANGGTYTT